LEVVVGQAIRGLPAGGYPATGAGAAKAAHDWTPKNSASAAVSPHAREASEGTRSRFASDHPIGDYTMTHPKKKTEQTAMERAHDGLIFFSPFVGVTANHKEAVKILAHLSNDELITLFNNFGDEYAARIDSGCIGSELVPYNREDENEAYFDTDEDTNMAIEDVLGCLNARQSIAGVHAHRMELAAKKAVKSARLKLV